MAGMNLLIDIGNSRCKWALAAPDAGTELTDSGYLAPDDHLDAQLEAIANIAGPPARALISCVGPIDVLNTVTDAAQDCWPGIDLRRFASNARACGVTNAYAEPAALGADRWAALIAAHTLLPGTDVVIAGCGTAVTLDVLHAPGLHLGGYILPGLKLMREALHRGTAALPLAEGPEDMMPARNTRGAIASGTLLGIVSAIEALVVQQQKTPESRVECLLSGGDAGEVGRNLTVPCRYESDLVLKGLAIAAEA
jgi:type III pantothenate kinase